MILQHTNEIIDWKICVIYFPESNGLLIRRSGVRFPLGAQGGSIEKAASYSAAFISQGCTIL